MSYSTGYLTSVFNTEVFRRKLSQAARLLRSEMKKQKIDAIAFTGVSGAAFAFPLSYMVKLPLICVRKRDNAHAHSEGNPVEGCTDASTYIIVDDFVSSGATVKNINRGVKKFYGQRSQAKPAHVGTLLYRSAHASVTFTDEFNERGTLPGFEHEEDE